MKKALASLLFCVVVNTALVSAAPPTTTPREKPGTPTDAAAAQASLTIEVSVQQTALQAAPVDNLAVYLCNDGLSEEIADIRRTGKLIAKKTGEYKAMLNDLTFMDGKARSKKVVQFVSAGQETYTLQGIPHGSYLLYAAYRDTSSAGYWLVPVQISGDPQQCIRLTRENMKELVQKK